MTSVGVTSTPGGVATEVVLFSVVAFKTVHISQGNVATHLRCGGIFSDSINVLLQILS